MRGLGRPLEADDHVVLPSGERAVVVKREEKGGFLELRYFGRGRRGEDEANQLVLHENLCRPIVNGVVPFPARTRGR